MSGRRVHIGRLRLTLAPGSDARAVTKAIARAIGQAPPTEGRARLSVTVGAPVAGEARGASARRVGRAVAAKLGRGGGRVD